MTLPAWVDGLTHKDWLFDGRPIRGDLMLERFNDLDWSRARLDMGPSPAGNRGPYWHVPLKNAETVHRLYPRVPSKWLGMIRQAIQEASETRDGKTSERLK